MFAYNSGMWACDTELMTLLHLYQGREKVVLLDANSIPRTVVPKELLEKAMQRHQEVLNDWMAEYAVLSQIRSAKHVFK